jgi:hypothetical protein
MEQNGRCKGRALVGYRLGEIRKGETDEASFQ